MCSIDWKMFLEYLKVLLDWPPVVLILMALFFNKFKVGINNFLGRVTEGSIFGGTFKAAPQNQDVPPVNMDNLQEQIALPNNETHLIAQLEKSHADAGQIVKFVKENPAHTIVEYKKMVSAVQFERCFNAIYGTQISLLDTSLSWGGKITIKDLVAFHIQHQNLSHTKNYPLEQYIEFLINFGLIIPKYDFHEITEVGKDFLSYIKNTYPLVWDKKAF